MRSEKRRLFTEGVFCPRSTAELGDRPGLVAARMIRNLTEMGYSRHSLNQQVRCNEDRERCKTQLAVFTKIIEEYYLRR